MILMRMTETVGKLLGNFLPLRLLINILQGVNTSSTVAYIAQRMRAFHEALSRIPKCK